MIGVALKGVLGRKLRATLTAFAIVLGVAMISGSFVLTDTLAKSFDGIYNESYAATDAVISSKEATDDADGDIAGSGLLRRRARQVEGLPGVRARRGRSRTRPASSTRTARDRRRRTRHRRRRRPDDDQSLNPLKLVTGRGPAATADRDRQGDHRPPNTSRSARRSARTATAQSRGTRSAGIVRFGTTDTIGGVTILVFDLRDRAAAVRQARQARPDPRRRQAGRLRPS